VSPLSTKIVVYQGEPGANSHIACTEVFPDWETVNKPTFEDAFAAVVEGTADLAMIPIENTIAGRVADIHHLMPVSGLNIVGEFFLPLQHQLMAVKGATLETVKMAYSHPHALAQCRIALKKLGLMPHAAANTASAARLIAEAKDPTKAAVASSLAAKIYGLDIIAADIADADHNTTRFIILSREPDWAPSGNARARSGTGCGRRLRLRTRRRSASSFAIWSSVSLMRPRPFAAGRRGRPPTSRQRRAFPARA